MLVRASSEVGVGPCITIELDKRYEDEQLERLGSSIGSANPGKPGRKPTARCALSVTNFRKIKELFPGARLSPDEITRHMVSQLQERKRKYDEESRTAALVKAGDIPQGLVPEYKFKIKPFAHQIVGWQFLHAMSSPALFGDCGVGKLQPVTTPILTPAGYAPLGDLKVGDLVMARDGNAYPITAVHPQGNKSVFRVTFSDGASTLAGNEHLWLAQTYNDAARNKPWRVLQTGDLRSKRMTYGKSEARKRWRIPRIQPAQFPERSLPIHPYLLGVLLGDGSISSGTPGWTKNEPWIAERIRPLLPSNHVVNEIESGDKAQHWSIVSVGVSENRVTTALKRLRLYGTLSHTKFVPPEYLFASEGQRRELLAGLLDTDGSAGNSIEYSSTSHDLAWAVQLLVESLGGRATIRERQTFYTHKGERKPGRPSWRVILSLPPAIEPFLLPRKQAAVRRQLDISRTIESVEPAGEAECVCISVASPDSTYVCERFIVTHNTFIAGTWADSLIKAGQGWVFLVLCPVNIIKHAWMLDLAKFTDLEAVRLHEPSTYKKKEKRAARYATDGDIYIINPESAIRHELELVALIRRHRKMGKQFGFIIDESSKIKNSKSKSYKVARKLRALADRCIIMTGTPSPNGIGDLWAQFSILDEGMTLQPKYGDYRLDTHNSFTMKGVEYVVGKGKNKKKVLVNHWAPKAGISTTVHNWIEPRMIRFRAEDCIDLPSKQFLRRDVPMSGEQARLYKEMSEFLYTELEGQGITARVAVSRLMKLREITGGFIITDKPHRSTKAINKDAPKMLELDLLLEQMLGRRLGDEGRKPTKSIVWAQYQWECKTLTKRYRRYGARGLFGGISQSAREDNLTAFKEDDNCQILVCHPASAGHGLTLTEANYAFYYSLSYNWDEFYQSARRIARPGQSRPMFFYFLITPGTIEELILVALENKQNVSDTITDGPFRRRDVEVITSMAEVAVAQQLSISLEHE